VEGSQNSTEFLKRAVARARTVLSTGDSEPVEKTIWSSPAGKKRLSKRLAAMLPAHKTYVEPFAGSAAVLFAKEPVAVEAINDADLEIVRAYKTIKRLGSKDLSKLRARKWTGDEATYKQLVASSPTEDVAWLHKFLYTTHFSYGKMRGKSFSPSVQGVEARTVDRIEQFAPRLKNVQVFGGDYRKVVSKFDSKDSAFFLDPPYVGYDVHVGEGKFDERSFFDVLKSLKGKFLITYGIRGELPKLLAKSDFLVKRIRTPRTIASMRGVGGPKMLTQLLVTNYEPAMKSLHGLLVEETDGPDGDAFEKTIALIKGADPGDERFVLGVVLEPDIVDAQGDTYSVDEVRQAAHRFLEDFGGLGFMHRYRVNGQVKILESYLAPSDVELGGVAVRKGTWLLAVHILSDDLWTQVRSGQLTGFSIGGSARRAPEPNPPADRPGEAAPPAEAAAA
jgi:DNA adenine methylase